MKKCKKFDKKPEIGDKVVFVGIHQRVGIETEIIGEIEKVDHYIHVLFEFLDKKNNYLRIIFDPKFINENLFYLDKESGNCECGSKYTSFPNFHMSFCPMNRRLSLNEKV